MKPLRTLLIFCAVLMSGGCTRLFFHPMPDHVFDPASAGIDYQAVEFEAEDSVGLHGWYLPSSTPNPRATVLFLYGNAQNKSTHIASVHWLPDYGFNVLLFDYRGYGLSEGKPNLEGMQLDIDAAADYLLSRPELSAKRIIVFGQSLGGALALVSVADASWRSQVAGVIVEGGFSGFRAIAREKLQDFWLTWPLAWPLSWTVDDRYSPLEAAPEISPIPLLLVYSDADEVVPSDHGQRLFDAARPPKELWNFEGVPHISAFLDEQRREEVTELMNRWLDESR